jgi:hypothetical protein
VVFVVAILLGAGCARDARLDPYQPHESLLSAMAEFQLLSARDPYRERVGRDLAGQDIAKATLVRLANFESLYPGRFDPELRMARGRVLEWLGDHASAARNYREVAEYGTELTAEATRRAALAERLATLAQPPTTTVLEDLLAELASQSAGLIAFANEADMPPFQAALARREAEQADVRRAELLALNRFLLPDGEEQALDAMRRLLSAHRDSARALEHALRLARLHRELAEEEARLNPPEGLLFNADRYKRHYDAAVELLYRVAQADGAPEKLLARHELDALLANGEWVAQRQR